MTDPIRMHFPWMTEEEEPIIRRLILEKAATNFEAAECWLDAAECWAELGEAAHAANLYQRGGDVRLAAETLLQAGHYAEALKQYQAWEASLSASDEVNRLRAMFAQAACHRLAVGVEGLSRRVGLNLYWQAYAHIEPQTGLTAARYWAALGEYGKLAHRFDLIHRGYEMALRHYETLPRAEAEKIAVCKAYLAVVEQYEDRLLKRSIEERLAEWGAWNTDAERPAWHRQRDTIEGYGFRDGVHDVIHFTNEAQWAAWHDLAAMEAAPDVDDYLRTLAPPEMVYIPAGAFLMGCDDAEIDEALAAYNATDHDNQYVRAALESSRGQSWVRLAGYYIDRTPVTNKQYQAFMEAGGYQQTALWTEAQAAGSWENGQVIDHALWGGGRRTQPAEWENERFQGDDKPVVGVTWYEALAYARWAGKALPSEAHWEKAAGWDPAAGQRRTYPWGDGWDENRCNVNAGSTTPVGQYSPGGDSAYGLADCAGNVYEWCSTRWGTNAAQPDYPYPYELDEDREDLSGGNDMLRIVRGGGWNLINPKRTFVRCGYRDRLDPLNGVIIGWGFRCLSPTHSSEKSF